MPLHRLAAFEQTRDHWWWRPGWSPGRRFLTFHLTFASAPELASSVAEWTGELTRLPNVHVVPSPWLHLTMTGIGFTDEVDPDALSECAEQVLAAARTLEVQPLVLTELSLHPEALLLNARPDPWLRDLYALQQQADLVDDHGSPQDFRPHVSVAYFGGPVDLLELEEAVAGRSCERLIVEHPTLSLIELGRDDQVYTWTVRAQQQL